MNPEPHVGPLRVAHLTVYRDLPSGVRKQLRFEQKGAASLRDVQWVTMAVHSGKQVEPFEEPIPRPFSPILLRSLYGWLRVLRLSREYDVVLLRHMLFDPFSLLFAPFVSNRVSVHHSKDIEELTLIRPGLTGKVATLVEQVTGRVAVGCAAAVLGVTGEVARHACARRGLRKPFATYPNGIELEAVELLPDGRSADAVTLIFMCATFTLWHGLDRLIAAVQSAVEVPDGLHIHLIGEIGDSYRQQIDRLGPLAMVFRIHGHLDQTAYRAVLATADVGLSSLALDRQNMTEGSTLKVPEMLASGLAVYSNCPEAALPSDFPYHVVEMPISLAGMVAFALRMKRTSRETVRAAAAPFVDKTASMQRVADWLRTVVGARRGAK